MLPRTKLARKARWIEAAAYAIAILAFARYPEPATGASLISLDIRDLDIYDAVRLLSTQSASNVVVDGATPHRAVTLRLKNITFRQALAVLAATSDLQTVVYHNVTYVGPGDVINRRYPAQNGPGARTQTFAIKNAAADDVATLLGNALPKETVVTADRRTSTIVVSGSPAIIERARWLMRTLDDKSAIESRSVSIRYVKASDALRALQGTLQVQAPAGIYANDAANSVILSGNADFMQRAQRLLASIDIPGQQVRYQVRVTDLTPSDSENVGVLFGGVDAGGSAAPGSGSTVTTFANGTLKINAQINALVTKGEASILAQPSLMTLNNVQASLLVGQQYPVVYFDARSGTQQVQFVNVGVNLSVTPTIGADGFITTDLETDFSQVTGTIATFPIIGTRKAKSTLRVRDGETIVIAGLFSDIDATTLSKVPLLGDIPLLGEIFKNRTRQHVKDEIVFLITPRLVADAGGGTLR